MKTVADFIFLGSKITADGDCSHEIKRCLLLGRKAMTNLSSVQFSCSVVSYSLKSHELQHARPPCPSPAGVQPPQDPGEPEGKKALAIDLERDKERMLKVRK